MKLQVMIVGKGQRRAIMLCDGSGTPLPGQRRVITKSETMEEAGTITVEFVIDGERVRLAGELAEATEAGRTAKDGI
jgi:hypothetical protein